LFSRFTAATALAAAGTLAGGLVLATTASAAPAHTAAVPKGWHRLGGLNEAAYCASASPRMGVAVARDDVNWDCTLPVRLPKPPGSVTTFKYQITQTDACRWEYPSHASKVKAINTTASPPALGWACYIPTV
jgi:hypothetical protein